MPDSATEEEERSEEISSPWDVLLDRLRETRLDNRFTDFTICCESREFRVHKVVLASASDYFAAMFANDTEEARENRVVLRDIKPKILELVIDYMYVCKIDLDEDRLEPVLRAAQYYQVEGLERHCTLHMLNELSSKNCLRYIELAKIFRINDLEQEAFRHALKNFEDVMDDGYFLKIDCELLSRLIESDNLEVVNEYNVILAISVWTLADEAVRKPCLPELIKLVRPTFISLEDLAELTYSKPIWESLECQRYLNAAKNYLHLKDTDNKWKLPEDLTSIRLNTKPRKTKKKKCISHEKGTFMFAL